MNAIGTEEIKEISEQLVHYKKCFYECYYMLKESMGTEPITHSDALAIIRGRLIQYDEIKDALYLALPYVEDAEKDPGYKPEAIRKLIKQIRGALREPC